MDRLDDLDSKDDMLCIGLLSLSAYSSSARATMLTQHLNQALVPDNPEIPAVCTGYEQMFGKYSTTYRKINKKLKIVKKIDKYPEYVYTLIVYDQNTDTYDIITRNEVRNMGEHYGFRYDNSVIDSYDAGDIIPKNTTVYKPPAIDDSGNFMYGVNGKVVYVVSQETIEDAVVISESFAKKLSTTKVDNCVIQINDNDVPLNLYGDDNNYKSFPNVGEKTKDSILCGLRRRNKSLDQLSMKNSNLRKIYCNDDIFQLLGDYKVVDIDIWCNKSYNELPDTPAYKQVKDLYRNSINYYKEIYDFFTTIKENGHKYSVKFSSLFAKARDYLDDTCKYTDDERIFSNIVMDFTLMKSGCKLVRGCKLCGRYGNKSVISKVIPDEEMGITEDGIVPDIRMDALGVLGRLNNGQSIEQELNWIAELVRREMEQSDSYKKKLNLLYKFIKMVNKKEYNKLVKYIDNLKETDGKHAVEDFIDSIVNDRIIIMQSPMDSISGDELYELYKEFKPKTYKMVYTDDDGNKYTSLKPMIVADEYILRLKQEPDTKFSVRYKSMINPRSFLPIKSTKAAKHKTIYSDQSNRIGEQELNVLMLSGDSDALDYFYRSHSSSVSGRRSTVLFENDSSNGFIIDMPSENSCVIDILNARFKSMGYLLNIQYHNSNDDNSCYDEYDIPEIPEYIKKLYKK